MTITHAFVAFRRCGGAMLIGVDSPDFDDPIGVSENEIAVLLRAGGRLERVTLDESREVRMCFGCEGCR